ncbi:MAG: DegT/DnrJ/EryC1/StrS family aminotransferase [Actinomycetes bacterium]
MTDLAILGGSPAFADGVPFVRPPAPPLDDVVARLAPTYRQGAMTNGPLVRELEATVAERLGVAHVLAVSSCTTGLMLAVAGLAHLGVIEGPVLMPSFTFSAGPHAVAWNGLPVVFAECDPLSFQLDLADAHTRLDGVGAIMATHVFGAPCRPEQVEALGAERGIPVLFDAAHGFGGLRAGRPLGGFGEVEVFSMTPTKPLVAGEGGLVCTDRDALAEYVPLAREYGNPGDYDTRFIGLNGRLSEMHAAVALASIDRIDEHLVTRRRLAARYAQGILDIPGLRVQAIDEGDESTFKDFTIAVDPAAYGVDRDTLVRVLRAEGVDTRNYFDPPVHRQRSHAQRSPADLPVTDAVARTVVSLPIYPALDEASLDRIVEILAAVPAAADRLRA